MSIITNHAQTLLAREGAEKPSLAGTVKHMAGMLWYEMLSEMNKSGLSAETLGTGGDDFQDMFLWNVAQNDFGAYDGQIADAAVRQIGGVAKMAPEAAPAAVPDFPAPLAQALQVTDMADAGGDASAVSAAAAVDAAPAAALPAADIVAQAKSFTKNMWPQIQAAAQLLGVSPVAVLAQSALETGWGAAAPGHNLFGIKAVDGEHGTSRPTYEMVDGVLQPQTASFRDYDSAAASVADYVAQIQSGYKHVVGQSSIAGFAHALQAGGYATDVNYAAKIISISQSPLMTQVLKAVSGTTQGAGRAPTAAGTGAT
jgi:flagellar protein FlgJ